MNPEDLLSGTLREQTEQTDYPSTPLATVVSRARAVRRRRARTATLAAAAAVAVVVAPTAFWLNRGSDTPASSGKPSSSSPTSSTTQPAAMALRALPRGPRPGLDYVAGNTYVQVGGHRRYLPSGTVAAVPAAGSGLLTFRTRSSSSAPVFESGTAGTISRIPAEGPGATFVGCGAQRFAVSADRTETAYWLMDGCDPSRGGTLHANPLSTMGVGGQQIRTPRGVVMAPIGFLGANVVADSFPTTGSDVEPGGVWVFGSSTQHQVPSLHWASAVTEGGPSGDLVAGDLVGGGSAVVDPTSGAVLWSAASGWSVDAFSLDGRYVVARSTAGDGNQLEILDAASGHLVTAVPTVRGTDVYGESWAEDGSLVILLATHHASALVRCTVHGRLSLATSVAPNPAHGTYYGFGTNP